jgi:CHASE2 domain-containing sensor protein
MMTGVQPDARGRDVLADFNIKEGWAIMRLLPARAGLLHHSSPRFIEFNPPGDDNVEYAALGFALPAPSVYEQSQFDYADLLTSDSEEKLARLNGRVVVLGSLIADNVYVPDKGSPVAGVVVHALAAEMLLRNHGFRDVAFGTLVFAALAASVCGWWSARRSRWQQVILMPCGILLGVGVPFLLLLWAQYLLSPIAVVAAFLLSYLLTGVQTLMGRSQINRQHPEFI